VFSLVLRKRKCHKLWKPAHELCSFATTSLSQKLYKYHGEEHGYFAASQMQQLWRLVKKKTKYNPLKDDKEQCEFYTLAEGALPDSKLLSLGR
jgi:hypothetical protein